MEADTTRFDKVTLLIQLLTHLNLSENSREAFLFFISFAQSVKRFYFFDRCVEVEVLFFLSK